MSNVKFNVKIESNGIIEYLKYESKKSDEESIFVGVQEKKKGDKPKQRKSGEGGTEAPKKIAEITNALIALWQEFGTKKKNQSAQDIVRTAVKMEFGDYHIPPRPFIRTALVENRNNHRTLREKLIKLVLNGQITLDVAKKRMGQKAADDVKKKITDLKQPPNSEATIAKKGFDKPLIDTAQMRNSVNYIIAKRKDIE